MCVQFVTVRVPLCVCVCVQFVTARVQLLRFALYKLSLCVCVYSVWTVAGRLQPLDPPLIFESTGRVAAGSTATTVSCRMASRESSLADCFGVFVRVGALSGTAVLCVSVRV